MRSSASSQDKARPPVKVRVERTKASLEGNAAHVQQLLTCAANRSALFSATILDVVVYLKSSHAET